MSAYMCSDEEFATLAAYAVKNNCVDTFARHLPEARSAGVIAQILAAENARSVDYRYDETSNTEGLTQFTNELVDQLARGKVPHVQIIALCHYVRYQSCETPDYEDTPACKILMEIRETAISKTCEAAKTTWGLECTH